jgi:hypothetical protein
MAGLLIQEVLINLQNAIEQIASEDLEKIFRTNYLLSKKFTLQSFVNNTDSFIERICTDDKRNK